MQGGHRLERGQVVGVGGAVGLAARGVEDVHGVAEPDFDPDGLERGGDERGNRAPPYRGRWRTIPSLGTSRPESRPGQSPDVGDRRGGPAGEHVDHLGRDAPGGAADRLEDVLAPDVLGVGADAQVGERRADAGALQHRGGQGGGARDARLHAGHLDGQEGGVDPGQDGDVGGIDPAVAPGRDGLDGQAGQRLGRRRQHGDRPASAQRLAEVGGLVDAAVGSVDVLVEAACVVGEHVAGGVDDGGRAAVVDGQGMGARRPGK